MISGFGKNGFTAAQQLDNSTDATSTTAPATTPNPADATATAAAPNNTDAALANLFETGFNAAAEAPVAMPSDAGTPIQTPNGPVIPARSLVGNASTNVMPGGAAGAVAQSATGQDNTNVNGSNNKVTKETYNVRVINNIIRRAAPQAAASAPASDSCGCESASPAVTPQTMSSPKKGGLRKEGNAIVTPGGYRIFGGGPQGWTILGPDGKKTQVWGDPHVNGDHKWSFNQDSSFKLPDGTVINAKLTQTDGKHHKSKHAAFTQAIEIENGGDAATIDGIAANQPVTSEVQHTGMEAAPKFGQVFEMGRDTGDWTLGGREVVSSDDNGNNVKLGAQEAPAGQVPGGVLRPATSANLLQLLGGGVLRA